MGRSRAGTMLLVMACALAFGTYLAWSFGTQSEAKAQYNANMTAIASGERARDIDPNRTPALGVAGATMAALAMGLALRKQRPVPTTAMPTSFWGRSGDEVEATADDP